MVVTTAIENLLCRHRSSAVTNMLVVLDCVQFSQVLVRFTILITRLYAVALCLNVRETCIYKLSKQTVLQPKV